MEVLVIFLILLLVVGIYCIIRNNYVYKYRIDLSDRCYEVVSHHLWSIPTNVPDKEFMERMEIHNTYDETWNTIIEQNSYDRMLYSFKLLKDKYWLTKEQIEWLHQYDNIK